MPIRYSFVLWWGFVTYSGVFFLWAVLSTYGLSYGLGAQVAGYITVCALVLVATRFLGPLTAVAAIGYGIGFGLMHIVLDALVLLPSIGFSIFFTPFVWVSYFVVAVTPLLYVLYSGVTRGNDPDAPIVLP